MRSVRVVGGSILCGLVAAACSGSTASEEALESVGDGTEVTGDADATADDAEADASSGGTVVLAISQEPSSMNPLFLDVNAGNWKAFDGLLRYDGALGLEPDLATDMPQVSDDGLEVMVSLRDDVAFHDGESFDAEDVVFTFEALGDPSIASPITSAWNIDQIIEDVRADDATTVVFSLSRPDPAFLEKLTIGIVPEHLLAGEDLTSSDFGRAPVGTGPYRFVDIAADEAMTFETNPDHHRGAPTIERVIYRFLGDENARAAALQEGSVDAAVLPPQVAASFDGDDGFQTIEIASASVRQMTLPTTNPVLAEPEVRRAISLAVDRQAILDGVEGGAGDLAYTPFIDGMPFQDPAIEVPFDPQEAQRLLDDAGWVVGDDGIRERDGERLSFTAMYLPNQTADQELSLAFRSDMDAIGIEVEVEAVDSPANEERFDTDAWVHGVGLPYDPDIVLYTRYHSQFADDGDAGTNRARTNDPAIDAALDTGRTTLDPDERADAYRDLQVALVEDGSYLHLVSRGVTVVLSSDIGGLEVQPMGSPHAFPRGLSWNLESWTLDR